MTAPGGPGVVALAVAAVVAVTAVLALLVRQRVRARSQPVGGVDVLVAAAVLLWSSGVVTLGLQAATGQPWDSGPGLAVAIGGTAAGGIAAALFVLGRMGVQGAGLTPTEPRWLGVGALVVPPFLALSAGWVALLEALGAAFEPQQLLVLVDGEQSAWVAFAAFAYGALGAPLTEELLFRGLFLTALRRRLTAGAAVVLQGVVFGVVHGADPAAIVPLAVLGSTLGWLRVRSRSLWPCVLAHAGNNAIALGLTLSGIEEWAAP